MPIPGNSGRSIFHGAAVGITPAPLCMVHPRARRATCARIRSRWSETPGAARKRKPGKYISGVARSGVTAVLSLSPCSDLPQFAGTSWRKSSSVIRASLGDNAGSISVPGWRSEGRYCYYQCMLSRRDGRSVVRMSPHRSRLRLIWCIAKENLRYLRECIRY